MAQLIRGNIKLMSLPTRIRSKTLLLTWPHCPVAKSGALETLWVSCKEWNPLYIVVAEEKHQDGSPHLHAAVCCANPIQIRKENIRMFDLTQNNEQGIPQIYHCNIKSCRSPKDGIRYTKKDGNFCVKGTCPYKDCISTAEKNKLLQQKRLMELVDSGEISLYKVPTLAKAISIISNERTEIRRRPNAPKVLWFWGQTGSGKTREAVRIGEEDSSGDYWISGPDGKWFDGYCGQKTVIIDDIRPDSWNFSLLLRITDRYNIRVPIKGGFVNWIPETIIITAPERPERVYRNHSTGEAWDGIEQLQRRITEVRHFGEGDEESGEEIERCLEWK